MSSPASEQRAIENLAATTPTELANDLRTATTRVHACAEAWRSSPSWRGDKLHRKAYEQLAAAITEFRSLPLPDTYRDVDHLVDAVAPILNGWWSSDSGPQQDLHDAVEQLRHVAMHKTALVRQARHLLGQPW